MLDRVSVHFATRESAAKLRAEGAVETRGSIASAEALFSRLAQALEFPDYFGHNWDALNDCLADVPGDVVLLLHDAGTLWREAPDVATALVEIWLSAAEEHEGKLHLVFVWS